MSRSAGRPHRAGAAGLEAQCHRPQYAGEQVTVVESCTRDGQGGSPTAVVFDDGTLTEERGCAVVRTAGTSHAAVVSRGSPGAVPTVRFFTADRELRNCGHGTIAAQAVLLQRSGDSRHQGQQRTGDRTFATTAVRHRHGVEVWFDQGVIDLRDSAAARDDGILAALGLDVDDIADGARIASPGTPRLLVPVRERGLLLSIRPALDQLATECRRNGYLGCFVYALSPTGRTATGRMFAPAIGVDEDIVNANSAGCLAAHLLETGRPGRLEVHQGDAVGRPSTVFAAASRSANGLTAKIGGFVNVPAEHRCGC
ncbi:PhzF family phenazine biosynthesis protein [Micromonospora zingiberis]|uniref:PhzF family phenazine biosynthesis protein n=1 Tax=Micromonospora zingiberis TaxID=2053011 RepID=A0A4R0GDE5_9ACTN|nr:PhzF family phenazine biosynthesis isomerase [Micromonospora zingiberis]TCB93378.1 PhzF family phenazine biosynthesis protein [Micromonospora zingiberis]